MKIIDFTSELIPDAARLAYASYEEERCFVPVLPSVDAVPEMVPFVENGLGVAAVEDGRVIGFLCGCQPFDHAFGSTDVRGIFSPMGANAAIKAGRTEIYAAMYQATGEKWVRAGAVSHAVCLYAHDTELHRLFFRYGFGLRCVDAIRPDIRIECEPCGYYSFAELAGEEYSSVYPHELLLYRHYNSSPFFMNRTPVTQEQFLHCCAEDGSRFFVARQKGRICAFVRITGTGETFAAGGKGYHHINSAYCLPEYRGKGVYQNLLNYVISVLASEGNISLGVDYESINPNAWGFWRKYFEAYTYGVVRRIDERILKLY